MTLIAAQTAQSWILALWLLYFSVVWLETLILRKRIQKLWPNKFFYASLFLSFLGAVSIAMSPNFWNLLLLLLIFLYWSQIWRGTFNGGSDMMGTTVLLGLTLSYWPPFLYLGLLYIGVQSLLSYFVAGVVKLKEPNWRNGHALQHFLATGLYQIPTWLQIQNKNFWAVLSLGVIAFEVLSPIFIFHQLSLFVFMAIVLIFHVMNSLIFGLNRFIFAWASSWPALYLLHKFLSGGMTLP
ncbi:MAG: HTTM domain-containing protein [Bdellovibrionia bacterium]